MRTFETAGVVYGNGMVAKVAVADRLAAQDAAQRAWLDRWCEQERKTRTRPANAPDGQGGALNAIQLQACPSCGKPLRADNGSGVCYLCQKAGRSSRRCSCGCGRTLSLRNRSGLSRACFLRAAISSAVDALGGNNR